MARPIDMHRERTEVAKVFYTLTQKKQILKLIKKESGQYKHITEYIQLALENQLTRDLRNLKYREKGKNGPNR